MKKNRRKLSDFSRKELIQGLAVWAAVLLLVVMCSSGDKETKSAPVIEPKPVAVVEEQVVEPEPEVIPEVNAWYEGDTSQLNNMSDWIEADEKTKLVFAADVVVAAHTGGHINIDASSIEEYKPYAEELVKQLDDFSIGADDSIKQQPIKSSAAMLMLMMWGE